MGKKKWILLLIIALPSSLWFILETSTINSHRLNFYGPKQPMEKGDTAFHEVKDTFTDLEKDSMVNFRISREEFPFFVVQFIRKQDEKEGYRMTGLHDFFNYKQEKIREIPFFMVFECSGKLPKEESDLNYFMQFRNVAFLEMETSAYRAAMQDHFLQKPYYIDEGYLVLIDQNRNIRGYYDGRYSSEIKRMSDEYIHLRLKSEKNKMLQENEIKKNH